MVYKSLIRSHLDYGSPGYYGSGSEPTLRRLDVLQNGCVRMCLGALRCTRVARMEVEANIPPLQRRRDALLLSYGMKTARKAPLGSTASKIVWQHHHLHTAALNSSRHSVIIFSESMSALQATESGRTATNEIQGNIINRLNSSRKSFSLIWVPGHSSLRGNEEADMLARSAVELEGAWSLRRDLQSCLSVVKSSAKLLWHITGTTSIYTPSNPS